MTAHDYGQQLTTMAERLRAWRARNADKTATVQFNFPRNVAIIAPIREAIKRGFVSVDGAGRELIEAMCDDGINEPTVLMVRAVLETK